MARVPAEMPRVFLGTPTDVRCQANSEVVEAFALVSRCVVYAAICAATAADPDDVELLAEASVTACPPASTSWWWWWWCPSSTDPGEESAALVLLEAPLPSDAEASA